ncbi:hypothetical protein NUU61_008822 [Penicillium alfredii]|uniref:BRCT domain-containing protein n=1 Tax=Penicillium alfredii TaxID=1506179 RepID=A0A9W9ELV4_9EURO|nr:uncharacterized protein NUU61_008822 [Penicillium alfredii]KAJ5084243.1 hypothetical protein NUU61_008822 [Penicillium alfredii]
MPPTKRPAPVQPQNHKIFDPWNSASTGHQRAEHRNAEAVAWDDVRADKLACQFQSRDCLAGLRSRSQCYGDSRENFLGGGAFDGRVEAPQQPGQRVGANTRPGPGEWLCVSDAEAERNQLGVRDIRSFMGVGKRKADDGGEGNAKAKNTIGRKKLKPTPTEKETEKQEATGRENVETQEQQDPEHETATTASTTTDPASTTSPSDIFAGITVFINGSTLPQISDHKLKHLLVAHGAHVSIAMARKTVTHVIVGQPNSGPSTSTAVRTGGGIGVGAGGGFAARKLQQEIARGGWKSVKVVGVDWALESIKAERRLAESRFAVLHVAAKGQKSVAGMFGAR